MTVLCVCVCVYVSSTARRLRGVFLGPLSPQQESARRRVMAWRGSLLCAGSHPDSFVFVVFACVLCFCVCQRVVVRCLPLCVCLSALLRALGSQNSMGRLRWWALVGGNVHGYRPFPVAHPPTAARAPLLSSGSLLFWLSGSLFVFLLWLVFLELFSCAPESSVRRWNTFVLCELGL